MTACDVTSDTSISLLADRVKREIARLGVLVINAELWKEIAIRVTEGSTQQLPDVVNTDVSSGAIFSSDCAG